MIRYAHQPAGAAHPGHTAFAQDAPATAQPSLQPSRGRAEPDGGGDLHNPIYQAIFQNSSTAPQPRDRSAHNIYSASAAPGSLYNTVQANTRARDSDPADQHLYQTQPAAGASPTAGSGARTASGARGWPSSVFYKNDVCHQSLRARIHTTPHALVACYVLGSPGT